MGTLAANVLHLNKVSLIWCRAVPDIPLNDVLWDVDGPCLRKQVTESAVV